MRETAVPEVCSQTCREKLQKGKIAVGFQCYFQRLIMLSVNFGLLLDFTHCMNSSISVLFLQYKKDKRGGFSLGISVRGLIVYEVSVLQS